VAKPSTSTAGWLRQSAWAGLLPAGRTGCAVGPPGVTVSSRDDLGLATVIARTGALAELVRLLSASHGIDLPARPVVAGGRAFDLVWAGPEQWLAVSDDWSIARRLADELAGLASVADQSDARAVLRIGGPRARAVLAKGCPLDLHPRAFGPGDTAVTAIAHVGVQLWQLDDAPTYELAVPRSMAKSFWTWLSASAAEFGLAVAGEAH
jgi:heterotetrameric sarcosine oxidase gamma subunit